MHRSQRPFVLAAAPEAEWTRVNRTCATATIVRSQTNSVTMLELITFPPPMKVTVEVDR
jgi:hypothetical protein